MTWLTIDEVRQGKRDSASLGRICIEANERLAEGIRLLAAGRWREGWTLYESRLRTEHYLRNWWKPYPMPLWDGSPLNGRKLLVHSEQGCGDCIMFARYLPLIEGESAFWCSKELAPLMRTLGGEVIDRYQTGFDVHCPLLSLPLRLGRYEPWAAGAYLTAETEPDPGNHVGVCWKGSPKHLHDAKRSMERAEIEPFIPGGWMRHSLQLGDGFDSPGWKYTANAIGACRLVVSVDTAVAHLAGALGVPVNMIIPHEPEWRWVSALWYKSMSVVRSRESGTSDPGEMRPVASGSPS